MFGADVAALRRLAVTLRHRQAEFEASRRQLSTIVETLPWSGPDRDGFVDEWQQIHRPALSATAADLGAASDRLRYHARRQELASQRG